MPAPLLLIISAPSGAGKTSLTRALVEQRSDTLITVSHTTRARRAMETHGTDYFFVDNPTFEAMIAEDAFVEYAQVFDNYYGTSWAAIRTPLGEQKNAILEIDWQGARLVRQQFAQAQSIFIMPPSLQALESRLRKRGQDDDKVIQRRMADAEREMSHQDEFDHVIVNNDFDEALAQLNNLIEAHKATV